MANFKPVIFLKKTITITFLLLLLFNQVGYYLFYMFQQYQIKEAVKHELVAKLPESSMEIIDANAYKNDIEWEEEDREFYLHGQMYDVAFIKIINGKKLIYCLNDSKEENLLKSFANAVNSGNEQNSSNKHHIIKFQPSDYVILSQHTIKINEPVLVKYINHTDALITNITEVFTPPPDLI
jgi:hypothetical protein